MKLQSVGTTNIASGCTKSAPVVRPMTRPMTLAEALPAVRALGAELRKLRDQISAMHVNMDEPNTFERVMTQKFGAGRSNNPVRAPGAVTLYAIWPGVAPYPTIQIDPASGQVYVHDEQRSSKWFGPLNVPDNAKVLGTFDELQHTEIASAFHLAHRMITPTDSSHD